MQTQPDDAVLLSRAQNGDAEAFGVLFERHAPNPGEARFTIDPTKTVTWPAPDRLACAEAGQGEFSCSAGADGARVYESFGRVARRRM